MSFKLQFGFSSTGVTINRYHVIGLSVVIVIGIFMVFSDEDMVDHDYYGIAYDIGETENGFTFDLDISKGGTIRCFSRICPELYGHYGVVGSFSDDRTMFFVSSMTLLDR